MPVQSNQPQNLPSSAPRAIGDRKRRAEPRSGRDPEEVWLGKRVPEDTLVRRARDRQHAADEQTEHDARRAQLP